MKRILIFLFLLNSSFLFAQKAQTNSPNFKEIYDFQVGDIFLYQITHADCGSGTGECIYSTHYEKFEILKKEINIDSVTYVRKNNDSYIDTITYFDSATNVLNRNNNDIVVGLINQDTVFFRIRIVDYLTPVKIVGGIGYTYDYNSGNYDSTKVWNINDHPYLEKIYGTGLGLIRMNEGQFEVGTGTDLIGYRKGNDTTGTLITKLDQKKYLDDIKVYPNPFMNQIFVMINDNLGSSTYDFYTTQGILVKSVRATKQTEISTADLKSGIYILKISNKQGTVFRKIFKPIQ